MCLKSIEKRKEVSFKKAELNRKNLEGEYSKKYNTTDVPAYESWLTYKAEFSPEEVVLSGPCYFFNEGWGVDTYKSKIYNGDVTFMELFHEFNVSINETGDTHHCFLEGIHVKERDGVKEVVFITGS